MQRGICTEEEDKLLETAVRMGDARWPLRQVIAEESIPAFISAFLSAMRTAMSGEKRVELQLRSLASYSFSYGFAIYAFNGLRDLNVTM